MPKCCSSAFILPICYQLLISVFLLGMRERRQNLSTLRFSKHFSYPVFFGEKWNTEISENVTFFSSPVEFNNFYRFGNLVHLLNNIQKDNTSVTCYM